MFNLSSVQPSGAWTSDRETLLFWLVRNGMHRQLFSANTPGLDLVEQVAVDPAAARRPGFDQAALSETIERLAPLIPDPYWKPDFGGVMLRGPKRPRPKPGDGPISDPRFPTPPSDPFDENFPPPPEETDAACPLVTVRIARATTERLELPNVTGLRESRARAEELARAAAELLALARRASRRVPALADSQDLQRQFEIIRNRIAREGIDLPDVPDVDARELASRARRLAVQIEAKAEELRTSPIAAQMGPSTDRVVTRLAAPEGITISGTPGTRLSIGAYSVMDSTYSNGRGQGTSYSNSLVPRPPDIPQLRADLPWFAKFQTPDGFTFQLGAAGEEVAFEGFAQVEIPANGSLLLPLAVNGNYGRAKIVLQTLGARCPAASALFTVAGPFEEEYFQMEQDRFRQIEAERDALAAMNDLIESILDLVAAFAAIFSIPGAVIAFFIKSAQLAVDQAGRQKFRQITDENENQRANNLPVAEAYPEMGPKGKAEDDVLR